MFITLRMNWENFTLGVEIWKINIGEDSVIYQENREEVR